MDGLKTELITRDFNRMLEELSAIDPAVEFRDVTLWEASRASHSAMGRTRAAKVASIRGKQRDAKFTTFGGKTYFLENRYPDYIWSSIERFRKERLQTKLGARGLARQTWYNIGIKLNRPFPAAAFVVNANYQGRQYTEDVDTIERGTGTDFTVTIINNSPLGEGAAMRNALLFAMGRRVGYFRQNMAHRAFRTLESRVKKYPGIFTSAVPPAAESGLL
jgi:hypothetical protein